MKTISACILLFFSLAVSAQEIQENILENRNYIDRTAEFTRKPLEKGEIVFLGNSLTQFGKWDLYFPDVKIGNRGIAGDNTLGMLGRLHEIIKAKPKKLFIMAGINDIAMGRSESKIMANIQSIIYQVEGGSPQTKIYIQSILPVHNDVGRYIRLKGKEKQIENLNKELKKFCKEAGILFIDVYPSLLEKKRKLDMKYTEDGLHLNDNGYAVWIDHLRKYVTN